MELKIDGIRKSFGETLVLNEISQNIASGGLTSILGPSGCGKTTLLRIIAGLEAADSGKIFFDGRDVSEVHPGARGTGFVFQHYALFRHMSVEDNVAFGLKVQRKSNKLTSREIRERVRESLATVELGDQQKKFPDQLSGGQRQRVALARAIVTDPKVLLLDEPFGALDARVRKDLRKRLRELHERIHVTSILVTHDREEAFEVSDKVIVMDNGRIAQSGSPKELYTRPANPFVYNFLGTANQMPNQVYVRPHEFDVFSKQIFPGDQRGIIRRAAFLGQEVRIEVEIPDSGERYEMELSAGRYEELNLNEGQDIYFRPRTYTSFLGMGL